MDSGSFKITHNNYTTTACAPAPFGTLAPSPEQVRLRGRDQNKPLATHTLHHVLKGLEFVLAQLPVVLHRRDVQLVLRLGFGRLEGAGQNGNPGVLHHLLE